ncbi:hypothetical protein BU26DRAFT_500022 [Trematosphaeria pertusa]|uniref:Uncharacterized protein n=1 Tax=Trematosphaeria pertusa TaxID=390896 RepID=A0A6A6IX90_9PLEO|nr:uncharacterized protein BU26DRAFT_500022 [Trematosphaeria pertusa]KAF2254230.1 hypothetical protein BU26DRAFT_500022 [Trematosphaeria pertusa]
MVHNCRRRWEGASAAPDATIFIPAFDFDTRDKSERSPPSSSSDGASNASAVGDSTSPPSPPSSPDRASNAPAVGDGGNCGTPKKGRGQTFLRGLGISTDDLSMSSVALARGMKHLVIERLLLKTVLGDHEETDANNREMSIAGITSLSLFVCRQWRMLPYAHIPTFIRELQSYDKLLNLAKDTTPWMKEAQLHYDSQGNRAKRKRPQEALSWEAASQPLATTVHTTSSHYSAPMAPPTSRRKLIRHSGEPAYASSQSYSQSVITPPPESLAHNHQTEHSSYSYGRPIPQGNESRLCSGAGNGEYPQQPQAQEVLGHYRGP